MTAAALRLTHVHRDFGTVEAVRDLSLDVDAGAFVALLGPSGCGKTTILRMLGGLDHPSQGAIDFEPVPDRISFCFQEPRLLPWANIRDNIALPLALRGEAKAARRARADALLTLVDLDGFGDHRPHQLSGGMRMRAALARALITDPQLLLLDEPFGALDAITRGQLDDALRRIWLDRRMTVVLVTHSIGEAVYMAETVHVLAPRPGRLIESLTIDLPERTRAIRTTPAFTGLVAQAFGALERGVQA